MDEMRFDPTGRLLLARAEEAPEGAVTGLGGPLDAVPLGNDWRAGYGPVFSADGTRFAWGTLEGAVLLAELRDVRRRLGLLLGTDEK